MNANYMISYYLIVNIRNVVAYYDEKSANSQNYRSDSDNKHRRISKLKKRKQVVGSSLQSNRKISR